MSQTIDASRFPWNNYKGNNRKSQCSETCMEKQFDMHVNLDIFLALVTVGVFNGTFIDKTNSANPLKREDFWRKTMKTMALHELNIDESPHYWSQIVRLLLPLLLS